MSDATEIYDSARQVVREWLNKQDDVITDNLSWSKVTALESAIAMAVMQARPACRRRHVEGQ